MTFVAVPSLPDRAEDPFAILGARGCRRHEREQAVLAEPRLPDPDDLPASAWEAADAALAGRLFGRRRFRVSAEESRRRVACAGVDEYLHARCAGAEHDEAVERACDRMGTELKWSLVGTNRIRNALWLIAQDMIAACLSACDDARLS